MSSWNDARSTALQNLQKEEKNKREKLATACLGLFALWVMLVGLCGDFVHRRRTWIEVEGTVISYNQHHSSKSGTYYQPVVSFVPRTQSDGKSFSFESRHQDYSSEKSTYPVGTTVTVLYNPNNELDAEIENVFDNTILITASLAWLVTLMGLWFCIMSCSSSGNDSEEQESLYYLNATSSAGAKNALHNKAAIMPAMIYSGNTNLRL